MQFVEALISSFGVGRVGLARGSVWFRAAGSNGSILRGDEPTGLTIPGLQSDDWQVREVRDRRDRPTLDSVFREAFEPVVFDPRTLTSLFGLKRERRERMRVSDLLRDEVA